MYSLGQFRQSGWWYLFPSVAFFKGAAVESVLTAALLSTIRDPNCGYFECSSEGYACIERRS